MKADLASRDRVTLAAVTIIAAAVRLFRLDHFSYGLDEIIQGYWIQGSWDFFWKSLRFDAVHPPLDYLLARLIESVHPADWVRKVPDVLWGTLTVPALALLVGRRAGRTAGIVSAILLAAAPFHVRYSQEFRPYSMSLFLLAAALLLFDCFLERPSAIRLALLFAATLATAYTLYFAALVLAIAAGAMVMEDSFSSEPGRRRHARRFLLWSPAFAGTLFLAYLPWWPVVVEAGRRPPMAAAAPLTLARADRTVSFFLFATEGDQPLGIAGALYLVLILAGLMIAIRRPGTRFLAAWSLGGFLAIELVGQLHPHYDFVRRFLPAGLALAPLAAVALAAIRGPARGRAPAALAVAAILLVDGRSLARYFSSGRADWRPLAAYLRRRPPGERVFTENQYTQLCVAFYVVGPNWLFDGGRTGRQIPNLEGDPSRLSYSWPPGERAWLVLAGEPRSAPLRLWAMQLPERSFPSAEDAMLADLEPSLREEALVSLPPPRR
ncbi:MAG TPA: glycosyltransferase family 39 protein [Thermoanaerobaculia bacterium]|nr:glycosyltransferase family 39 protein [Thermoanaerobaculia bacterium]